MFEATIRGITRQFDTPAELAEWRERMLSPSRPKRRKKPKRKYSSRGLADIVKERHHGKQDQ